MIQKELFSVSQRSPLPESGEPLIGMTRRQLDAYTKEVAERIRQQEHTQLHQRLREAHEVIFYETACLTSIVLIVFCYVLLNIS